MNGNRFPFQETDNEKILRSKALKEPMEKVGIIIVRLISRKKDSFLQKRKIPVINCNKQKTKNFFFEKELIPVDAARHTRTNTQGI